jgi:hypothetical protein
VHVNFPPFLAFQLSIILRKAFKAHPNNLFLSTYSYSCGTANSNLHTHIEKHHHELYLALAEEQGWRILLPGLVTAAQGEEPVDI